MNECSPSARGCDPVLQAKLAGDQAANIPADQLQQPTSVSSSRQQQQPQLQQYQQQQRDNEGFDPNEFILADDDSDDGMKMKGRSGSSSNEDFYIRIAIAFLFLTQLYIIFRMNNSSSSP